MDKWIGAHDVLVVRESRCEPKVFMTWETFSRMLGVEEISEEWNGFAKDDEIDCEELAKLIRTYIRDKKSQ